MTAPKPMSPAELQGKWNEVQVLIRGEPPSVDADWGAVDPEPVRPAQTNDPDDWEAIKVILAERARELDKAATEHEAELSARLARTRREREAKRAARRRGTEIPR